MVAYFFIFVDFRNVSENKVKFRETFHDNDKIDMAGYTAVGRLYAIGYLKGLIEAIEKE